MTKSERFQFPVSNNEQQWVRARETLQRFLSFSVREALELEQPWCIVEELREQEQHFQTVSRWLYQQFLLSGACLSWTILTNIAG